MSEGNVDHAHKLNALVSFSLSLCLFIVLIRKHGYMLASYNSFLLVHSF